jgi:hypothetical protein
MSRIAPLHTQIPPATVQAYLETDYRVLGDAPFTLKIDAPSAALAALYAATGASCSAFITAWNPFSEPARHPLANDAAQRALRTKVAQRGLRIIDGIGQHPSGDWPGEASLLVLGLEREMAQDLGRQFRQNAVIWCGANAIPELILLR